MRNAIRAIVGCGTVLIMVAVVGLGALVVISGGNVVDYVQTSLIRFTLAGRQDELQTAYGTDDTPRRFEVATGTAPRQIAQQLVNADLIGDADLFVDYVRVEGLDRQLEAGTYFLRQIQTIPEIALALTDSRNSSITFRLFEGSRIEEIAQTIDANGLFSFDGQTFLTVVSSTQGVDPAFIERMGIPVGAALEGFLFPDTYILPPDISAEELRQTLLDTFAVRVTDTMIADAQAQGLTVYEAVIIASITEREAVWDEEKPAIAGVYRNRLAIGMKLDADPTVQYGLQGARGSWWPALFIADYQSVQSPYNTYINNGLPPGPIANPGLAAIQAAIYPEQSEYFFFRARCDGSAYHNFAVTFDEHLANGCAS